MEQAKNKPGPKPKATPVVETPVVETSVVADPAPSAAAEGELMDDVVAEVPKAFTLRIGDQEIRVQAGAQRMLREHAEHWYAQANGVRVVK